MDNPLASPHGALAAAGVSHGMKFQIRQAQVADGPQILALLRGQGLAARWENGAADWKFWRPTADWDGPRSYVLTHDDRIVAHAGVVPARCVWDGERARIAHVIDWAASAPGAGVSLMKYVGRLVDALVATEGSSDTLRVLPIIGFRPCGTIGAYVLPLHPFGYLRDRPNWNVKTPARIARNLLWSLAAPRIDLGPWRARALQGPALPELRGVLPKPRPGAVTMERSLEQLAHILACPIAAVALYAIERAGSVLGYFVLTFVPGQARLCEAWLHEDEPAAWRALVLAARGVAATRPGVVELVAATADPRLARGLLESGFHARYQTTVQLLPTRGGKPLPGCPQLQMFDSDAAYRHQDGLNFWA